MVVVRASFNQSRATKKLGSGEEIRTWMRKEDSRIDQNIAIPCGFCSTPVLMSTIRAVRSGENYIKNTFCSPVCKLKFFIKDKDPQKCWVFTRAVFMWDDSMFSFRTLCYQLHFNEKVTHSRDLTSNCGEKRCANPIHIYRRPRFFSLDP